MTDLTVESLYLAAGVALLLAATVPRLFRNRAVSAPMLVLGVGAIVGLVVGRLGLNSISPRSHPEVTEYLAEMCVIVALMGVGLAIDRPLRWRTWNSTWRLLLIAMPICIVAVAVFGWWVAALTPAAAVLFGAVTAPTDPVLASDVQVEGPTSGEDPHEEDDEVRFALTSEAGLNDALAFPFVYFGIFLAVKGSMSGWFVEWLVWDLVGKIAIGVAVGWISGDLLGRAFFRLPIPNVRLADRGEPIAALAAVFAVYGVTQLVGGYGFLAVFLCAVAMRRIERGSDYHGEMHGLIEQLEHVLTLVVLLVLGAALTSGLLSALSWRGALVGVVLILVIRPAAGWLSLQRSDQLGTTERRITSFFGIRGIGSLYYMSYVVIQTDLGAEADELWAMVAFTIVLSVVVHGASAGWVMTRLERQRERDGALS
ncbi:cation:proton antiporter [Gordonia insulae]|nr:sodium:proton antiporter [Gordonia insulae]